MTSESSAPAMTAEESVNKAPDPVTLFFNGLYDPVKAAIRCEAHRSYPDECCGLIVNIRKWDRNWAVVWPCRNMALDKRHNFLANPEDVMAAEDAGDIIMGYHSHVDTGPTPSMADKVDAERNERPSLIVAWPGDIWASYTPIGYKAPLLGRPFVYGILDCYTLVRDWYRENGVELPDFDHGVEGWWERKADGQPKANLCMDNYKAAGFKLVPDLRPGDLILMQAMRAIVPNHCGVYLGDGIMLHHPPGRLSTKQPYLAKRGFFHSSTRAILRHPKLKLETVLFSKHSTQL